jgi:hypothetical protein
LCVLGIFWQMHAIGSGSLFFDWRLFQMLGVRFVCLDVKTGCSGYSKAVCLIGWPPLIRCCIYFECVWGIWYFVFFASLTYTIGGSCVLLNHMLASSKLHRWRSTESAYAICVLSVFFGKCMPSVAALCFSTGDCTKCWVLGLFAWTSKLAGLVTMKRCVWLGGLS